MSGLEVLVVGLGCMGMLGMYGFVECEESIVIIYVVFDIGIDFFDIGDFYGMGYNEMFIGEVICGCLCEDYWLSVKFGV